MKSLVLALKKQPIVYITLDIERALGIPITTKNYFIITNSDVFSNQFKKNTNILLIKAKKPLTTWELLKHPKTTIFLKKIKDARIVVFKNTPQIEKTCQEKGWILLNPPAKLADVIEEKISQIDWLGPLKKYLPAHEVTVCKKVVWKEKKFILQFNKAHTGNGTFLIDSKEKLVDLKHKFPERPVRILQFISGPTFTSNMIVWNNQILTGPINYQITGLSPFTDRKFATIGNDWALPHKLLSKKQQNDYFSLAKKVGKHLAKSGWKGLFGIDVVQDEKTGTFYLIEINARQPASVTCESILQKKVTSSKLQTTTFEAHLASLLEIESEKSSIIQLKKGAQLVKRIIESEKKLSQKQKKLIQRKLIKEKFSTIIYQNTEPGSELIRIQTKNSFMKNHNEFNKDGKKVRNLFYESKIPALLKKVRFNFSYDSKKIWSLHVPVTTIDIKKLVWHLNLPFWEKEGTDEWNLTPKQVLKNPAKEPTHYKKILEASLKYPLDIMLYNGKWTLLDGLHRLTKAYMLSHKEIKVRIIPKNKISKIRKSH